MRGVTSITMDRRRSCSAPERTNQMWKSRSCEAWRGNWEIQCPPLWRGSGTPGRKAASLHNGRRLRARPRTTCPVSPLAFNASRPCEGLKGLEGDRRIWCFAYTVLEFVENAVPTISFTRATQEIKCVELRLVADLRHAGVGAGAVAGAIADTREGRLLGRRRAKWR
jgi:hypothetical protein